jgi:predicted component of viral defense system (DUF524 family)
MIGSNNMDSPASSKIQFLATDGTLHSAPREWTPYTLVLDVPAIQWRNVELRVQNQRQPVYLTYVDGSEVICANWSRANTGHYDFQVRWLNGSFEERITVRPAKIDNRAFDHLLADLHRNLAIEVAISLQRTGGLTGFDLPRPSENTIAAEITRLHRTLLGTQSRIGLLQVLQALASDPHNTLRSENIWTQRWRARRSDPGSLSRAVAKPDNLAKDNYPIQVLDHFVKHTVDTYENRILKLYVQQVDHRLRNLRNVLLSQQKESLQLVESLGFQLRSALNAATFLQYVSLLTQNPTNVSMVLTNRPEYRAMFQGFLEFRRSPFVRLDLPELDAPLENLPKLYQVWGTLTVIRELIQMAQQQGYRLVRQQLVRSDVAGLYVEILPRRGPNVELGHPETGNVVRVYAEPTIGLSGSKWKSVSYSQRPDLVIEIHQRDKPVQLLIFDPKYKLREDQSSDTDEDLTEQEHSLRPIKADIDKMHTYRDAIRDFSGVRIVSYAAILYPGLSKSFDKEIAALGAVPGAIDSLLQDLRQVFSRYLV